MPLYQILPAHLPTVWPIVAPMLQKAIDVEPDAITIEQVEYQIRIEHMYLLAWEEPEVGITGAATVKIVDHPRERVAHVTLMGGKGIVRPHVFAEAMNWMRSFGATKAECITKGSLVGMYEKMGLENTHQIMQIKL